MRKLCVTLSIALLVAICATGAMAETIEVEVIQISDPVLIIDGGTHLDLTGLTLQMAGGATADGALAQCFIDLYADDTNISSAVFQKSEDVISFFLSGMENAYSMPADEFETEMGSLNGGFGSGVEQVDFENWALPEDLSALFLTFMEENTDPESVRAIDVALMAGETKMTEVPFAGDCTELFYEIAAAMDEDMIITSLFASVLGTETGFEELLREGDFKADIEGSIATTEDGTSSICDIVLNTIIEEEQTSCTMHMLVDGSVADVQKIDLKYTLLEEDRMETIQLNGTIDGDAVDLTATLVEDLSDDYYDALYDIRLTVKPGKETATGKETFTLTIREEYENVDVVVSGYLVERTGEAYVELTVKDQYTDANVQFSYLPDEVPLEGANESGTVEFRCDDGYDHGYGDIKFTCAFRSYDTTIDTDDFYIDPNTAIDISSMSDVEGQAALNELEMVLFDALGRLEEMMPDLRGITDELFGYYDYDEVF